MEDEVSACKNADDLKIQMGKNFMKRGHRHIDKQNSGKGFFTFMIFFFKYIYTFWRGVNCEKGFWIWL